MFSMPFGEGGGRHITETTGSRDTEEEIRCAAADVN
jgi:hypothetical protein